MLASRMVVYCDNFGIVMLAHNLILYSRTKHMKPNLA